MIRDLISRIREKCASLYVQLTLNIILGILVGVVVYTLCQLTLDQYVQGIYISADRKLQRESLAIDDLAAAVDAGNIGIDDMDAIYEWTTGQRYKYFVIYDGDNPVFTSDLGPLSNYVTIPESAEKRINSGMTVDYPTNATLRRYAEAGVRREVAFADGALLVSVVEFSEYFCYDMINIMSIALAMLSLSFVVFNYFRRVIKRIKRLEADVTIVTHISMEHKIATKGLDEISRLTSNVENMRNTILENLQREREARDSNTELITAMSHDIRTPLTVMLGYLEMMKSEEQVSPVMQEYIEATEKTAMRLKQLSDDMFKYSLAFGDAIEGINLEEYDASMLFEQMLAEHVLLLRENEYNVVVSNDAVDIPMSAKVMTDAQNLMRIIDNVFSNLYKYADKANPVYITIAYVEGRRIAFECVNTVRTDTYKAESNGIGLKTCSRLAQVVAESFEFGENDGKFICRLSIPFKKNGVHFERFSESVAEGEENRSTGRGIGYSLAAISGYIKGLFTKGKDDGKIKPISNLLPADGGTLKIDGERVQMIEAATKRVTQDAPEKEAENEPFLPDSVRIVEESYDPV